MPAMLTNPVQSTTIAKSQSQEAIENESMKNLSCQMLPGLFAWKPINPLQNGKPPADFSKSHRVYSGWSANLFKLRTLRRCNSFVYILAFCLFGHAAQAMKAVKAVKAANAVKAVKAANAANAAKAAKAENAANAVNAANVAIITSKLSQLS